MQNIQDKVDEMSVYITDYIQTLYKLGTVKATEKAANTAAHAITATIIILFSLIIVLIGGIGMAWWLGDLLNNMAGGFFIVTGFYFICLAIILLIRKKILLPIIRNKIVRKIYE